MVWRGKSKISRWIHPFHRQGQQYKICMQSLHIQVRVFLSEGWKHYITSFRHCHVVTTSSWRQHDVLMTWHQRACQSLVGIICMQPINQSINQLIIQPINYLVNRSINQSINQWSSKHSPLVGIVLCLLVLCIQLNPAPSGIVLQLVRVLPSFMIGG